MKLFKLLICVIFIILLLLILAPFEHFYNSYYLDAAAQQYLVPELFPDIKNAELEYDWGVRNKEGNTAYDFLYADMLWNENKDDYYLEENMYYNPAKYTNW